ncbi:hypothetical protein [Streptomyces sp. CS62]|uniref:hypothetical protein n=1 Tax=Streptomyces sp. CS62 TaxID=3119268 RepID=UPI002F954FF9
MLRAVPQGDLQLHVRVLGPPEGQLQGGLGARRQLPARALAGLVQDVGPAGGGTAQPGQQRLGLVGSRGPGAGQPRHGVEQRLDVGHPPTLPW